MADHLNRAVRIVLKVACKCAQICLQISAERRAVGGKQNVLRQCHDQAFAGVGDHHAGIAHAGLKRLGLTVKLSAHNRSGGGTNDRPPDGPLTLVARTGIGNTDHRAQKTTQNGAALRVVLIGGVKSRRAGAGTYESHRDQSQSCRKLAQLHL